MIIFYDKSTGSIIGTIHDKKHTEDQLNAWIGDKEQTNRIVIEWKEVEKSVFIPESQEDIMNEIYNDPARTNLYKVEVGTKKLVLK